MSLGVAWVLVGGMVAAAGMVNGAGPGAGFIIAIIASMAAKSGKWYLWKKKDKI